MSGYYRSSESTHRSRTWQSYPDYASAKDAHSSACLSFRFLSVSSLAPSGAIKMNNLIHYQLNLFPRKSGVKFRGVCKVVVSSYGYVEVLCNNKSSIPPICLTDKLLPIMVKHPMLLLPFNHSISVKTH